MDLGLSLPVAANTLIYTLSGCLTKQAYSFFHAKSDDHLCMIDGIRFTAKGNRLIAESSGFTIAKDKTPQPPIEKPVGIELFDGPNAGEMWLVFLKVMGAKSYMYQVSLDPLDETKWTTVCGTTRKNLFTGLESGKKYYVRVVALGINKQVVYSDVFSRMVQ
jgi:hypothetical protein